VEFNSLDKHIATNISYFSDQNTYMNIDEDKVVPIGNNNVTNINQDKIRK
jgi:hypothetical protein